MIPGLPKWVNFSIIIVLVFGIAVMFIFSINTKLDQDTFISKWDKRIKISDERYQKQQANDAAEKASDDLRTKVAFQILNETKKIVNETRNTIGDLIYIIQVRLSNHTIHTDRELGDLNGNLSKLIDFETKLLQNRTPLFADILENQRTGIQNQYIFGKGLNISGVSNSTR